MRPLARAAARLAAMSILAFALSSQRPTAAAAAENWDLYIYNPVATVAAVKGMNVIIEQIEKETNGELKVRLHLGRLAADQHHQHHPGRQRRRRADGR